MGRTSRSTTGHMPRDHEKESRSVEFMAELSREMRAPLSLVFGPIHSLLQSENLTETQRRALSIVERNASLLLSQAATLGEFSAIESGRLRLTYTSGDAAQLLRTICDRTEQTASKCGVICFTDIPRSLVCECDFEKLQYAILAHLSAALGRAETGSTVHCQLRGDDRQIEIIIRGPGQGPYATSPDALVAAGYMKALCGSISASGNGETYVTEIHFPRYAPESETVHRLRMDSESMNAATAALTAQKPAPILQSTETADRSRPLVLLIEKNRDVSAYIMDLLSKNYDVTAIPDVSEAITRVRHRVPDVIIHGQGREVFGRSVTLIRAERTLDATPIIALLTDEQIDTETYTAYVQEAVRMPFLPEDLQARVANLINQKRSVDGLQTKLNSRMRDLSKLAADIAAERVETRRIYEKLREQQKLMQAVIDASPMAVFVRDTEGNLLYRNKLYDELMHGVAAGVAVSDTAEENSETQTDDEVDLTSLAPSQKYVAIADADGRDRFYVSLKFPLLSSTGKPYAVCGIATDITEHVEFERRKDEFIASTSHELKTPVTSLKVLAQIIQERSDTSDPVVGKAVEGMRAEIARLTRLVHELSDLSKLQSSGLQYHMESVDVAALVRSIARPIAKAHTSHRIKISSNRAARVHGDPTRLAQAVRHLIMNAIKFSPGRDCVEVAVTTERDAVHISVRDHGIGIRREHLAHVFDCFYRTDDGTRETFPGLGVGLYISSEIIRGHGGSIWVESASGKGSVFHVLLPRTRNRSAHQTHLPKKKSSYEKNSRG